MTKAWQPEHKAFAANHRRQAESKRKRAFNAASRARSQRVADTVDIIAQELRGAAYLYEGVMPDFGPACLEATMVADIATGITAATRLGGLGIGLIGFRLRVGYGADGNPLYDERTSILAVETNAYDDTMLPGAAVQMLFNSFDKR